MIASRSPLAAGLTCAPSSDSTCEVPVHDDWPRDDLQRTLRQLDPAADDGGVVPLNSCMVPMGLRLCRLCIGAQRHPRLHETKLKAKPTEAIESKSTVVRVTSNANERSSAKVYLRTEGM